MTELAAGRFALIDPIGRGATGQVWRAYDTRERRYCAAKLFRRRDAVDLIRIVREQGVRLSHPHVVSPYAWAADDDDVVIALDLVHGGPLTTLIRDHGALPEAYAARVLGQLLAALEHVHAAGLLHRDVKPDNVLMEATGTGLPHARLADFGVALRLDEPPLTDAGRVLGTLGYLPPEVFDGASPAPSRDLYAAGIVAVQMLTGAEGPAPPGPDVPSDGLGELVRALCDPEPGERPDVRTARAMLDRLDLPLEPPARTEDGEPVEVFDQLGPLPARPRRRRRRTAVLAGATTVLVAAGAVTTWQWPGGAPAKPFTLRVMSWATCADGESTASPADPKAICVNGRRTDKVANGIRWYMRGHPGLRAVLLQEVCSADVRRLAGLDGMAGWHFRFAAVMDEGNGTAPTGRTGPRACHPRHGESRGSFGVAVGLAAPAAWDVHYYSSHPTARDRWGHWNVRQVAVCGMVAAYRTKICGTQFTPLRDNDSARSDPFWAAQAGEARDLLGHAGTNGRVVVGGDLNTIPPDAAGGIGDRSAIVPLYAAYQECDQAIQGGLRAGRGTYQHKDGTRGTKLDYLFTNRTARVTCDVPSTHVSLSDQVPITATIAFP